HNLPLWGQARPKTLLWLVVYDNGHRNLVHRGQAPIQAHALLEGELARGLPLILPMEGGGGTLKPADITGGFRDHIQNASGGYDTRHVAFGQVAPAGSGWRGSISLMVAGTVTQQWHLSGQSRQDILHDLVNSLADYYAGRYALVPSKKGATVVRVTVSHLRNLTAYARVSKYVKGMDGVNHAGIVRLEGQTGYFQVTSDRGRSALARAISLNPTLEKTRSVPGDGSGSQGGNPVTGGSP